jgi:hypothetical protein
VGSTASTYVFALAPPSAVVGAVAQKDARFGTIEKGRRRTRPCSACSRS